MISPYHQSPHAGPQSIGGAGVPRSRGRGHLSYLVGGRGLDDGTLVLLISPREDHTVNKVGCPRESGLVRSRVRRLVAAPHVAMRGEELGWDGLSRCTGPSEMKVSSVRHASSG